MIHVFLSIGLLSSVSSMHYNVFRQMYVYEIKLSIDERIVEQINFDAMM